jgi:hypothetical protein
MRRTIASRDCSPGNDLSPGPVASAVTRDTTGRVEWLARCLGTGKLAPVERDDVEELAGAFHERFYGGGNVHLPRR